MVPCRSYKGVAAVFKATYLIDQFFQLRYLVHNTPGGGGGLLPYKGLMGTCGQLGYRFYHFFALIGVSILSIYVLNSCK